MINEVGLTQTDNYPLNLLSLETKDLLKYEYKGQKSQKSTRLKEFSYIDLIYKQEEGFIPTDRLNYDNNKLIINGIIFSNNEKLYMHNYSGIEIKFINCIFVSRILFDNTPKSLNFDSCVFQKCCSIAAEDVEELNITSCIINRLSIYNSKIKDIMIVLCKIKELSFNSVESSITSIVDNDIYNISVVSFKHEKLTFDINQLHSFKNQYIGFISKIKRSIEEPSKTNIERNVSTVSFLQTDTTIDNSPILSTKLEYIKMAMIKHGIFNSIIMRPFGFFLLPGRIALLGAITCIIFTIIFYLHKYGFSLNNICNCKIVIKMAIESFLGTTQEVSDYSYLALSYIERVLGFFIFTAFTISLAKKYVK